MTRVFHNLFSLSVSIVFLQVAQFEAAEPTAQHSPPNLVLIISDDQTYTDFGFMGHESVRTPHLDRLVSESLLYTHGYVPTSVCRPSLVTLLTGQYPHQHGVYFNHPPPGFSKLTRSADIDKAQFDALRQKAAIQIHQHPTLPGLLAQLRGYRCLQTGKYWEGHWRNARFTEGMTLAEPSNFHLGNKALPNGEIVAHGNGDAGLAIGRDTMQPIADFLDDLHGSPFFLWYAPFLPHTPHDAPQRFRRPYDQDPRVEPHQVPYFASISQFDESVGQLINMLQAREQLDNTLILFVVDNGWEPDPKKHHESTGEWDHTKQSKRSPFEPGLRTPIFIYWKDHITTKRLDRLVSSIDIAPTLLNVAGIDTQSLNLPGGDLLDPEFQSVPQSASTVFGEIYPGDATAMGHPAGDIAYRWIRSGNFKLIVPHRHSGKPAWGGYLKSPALFNVAEDPKETQNLLGVKQHTTTVQRLRQQLNTWWTPTD